jgi:hypothetical protein
MSEQKPEVTKATIFSIDQQLDFGLVEQPPGPKTIVVVTDGEPDLNSEEERDLRVKEIATLIGPGRSVLEADAVQPRNELFGTHSLGALKPDVFSILGVDEMDSQTKVCRPSIASQRPVYTGQQIADMPKLTSSSPVLDSLPNDTKIVIRNIAGDVTAPQDKVDGADDTTFSM